MVLSSIKAAQQTETLMTKAAGLFRIRSPGHQSMREVSFDVIQNVRASGDSAGLYVRLNIVSIPDSEGTKLPYSNLRMALNDRCHVCAHTQGRNHVGRRERGGEGKAGGMYHSRPAMAGQRVLLPIGKHTEQVTCSRSLPERFHSLCIIALYLQLGKQSKPAGAAYPVALPAPIPDLREPLQSLGRQLQRPDSRSHFWVLEVHFGKQHPGSISSNSSS